MKNEIKLSPVIAGCMKWGKWGSCFSTADYLSTIESCVENNITSFDHADIYGDYTTEKEFGDALKNNSALRTKIQLITKCGIKMLSANRPIHQIKSYDTSYNYIVQCVEKSLENLHTDYIDFFLIHRPDPLMDPVAIAEAFTKLKQQGKVLHSGVSNFTPAQVSLINNNFPVEVNQIEISISHLEPFHNGQLDQCFQENIIPMAWSPLGGGSLFSKETDQKNKKILDIAESLGKKYDTGIANILLAFLTTHPAGIIPVLGTSKIERLNSAIANSGLRLEREEWFMLWAASAGHDVP
jgi:predicted oxidoreductase